MNPYRLTLRRYLGEDPDESDELVAKVRDAIETYFALDSRPDHAGYRGTHAFRRRKRKRLLAELDISARDRFMTVVGRAFEGMRITDTTCLDRSSALEASIIVRQSLEPDGPVEKLTVFASVLGPFYYASLESLRLPDGSSIADEPEALFPHLAKLESGFIEHGIQPVGELALYRAYGVYPELTDPNWVLVFHCLFDERMDAAMVYDKHVGGRTLNVPISAADFSA